MKTIDLTPYSQIIGRLDTLEYSGEISEITGLTVKANGPISKIGHICKIYTGNGDEFIWAEVVGFKDKQIVLMPFYNTTGIGTGCKVVSTNNQFMAPVGMDFIGRVVDALGNPIDGKGPITIETSYPVNNEPPNPMKRERIKDVLPLGIKAIDGLLTVGRGQRLGIFAGSGVGKSTLLGMIAREARADIIIITLVGERGREVRDFLEKDLKDGLARSVLVVATSDQPALLRMKSALVGTAFAEYFRDKGYSVLLLMDSVTRFARAMREMGMAAGEPPVSRGYTPSVFDALPKLLERSGTSDKGSITALYTVLVDGDDLNEPISDEVRSILDGHIVLNRELANLNHYPAIDVLASISRLMPEIASKENYKLASEIKNKMSVYKEAQELINVGAYQRGSNPDIDDAIKFNRPIKNFLLQDIDEKFTFDETLSMMQQIMSGGMS